MSYQSMGQLIDKWMTDGEFRKNLRKDPEGTFKRSGLTLSQDEWTAIKQIDWKQSDEQLKSRINKLFG